MKIGDTVEISTSGKLMGINQTYNGVQYNVEFRAESGLYQGQGFFPLEAIVQPMTKEEYKLTGASIGQPEELGNGGEPIPDGGLDDYLYEQEKDRRLGL